MNQKQDGSDKKPNRKGPDGHHSLLGDMMAQGDKLITFENWVKCYCSKLQRIVAC